MNNQFYINRAEACLKGIENIKQEINKCKTNEEKGELAAKYLQELEILERSYIALRAAYDPTFRK